MPPSALWWMNGCARSIVHYLRQLGYCGIACRPSATHATRSYGVRRDGCVDTRLHYDVTSTRLCRGLSPPSCRACPAHARETPAASTGVFFHCSSR
jgi:hypothetical protein